MVSTQQKSNTGLDSSVNSIEASSKIIDKITELLELALTYHQAGQLEEAEHLYQTILDVDPAQPKANHNLGILALNAGKHDAALQYLKTALEADPIQHQFWVSYVNALIDAGCNEIAHNVLMQGLEFGLQGDDVAALVQILSPQLYSEFQPKRTNKTSKLQQAMAFLESGKLGEAKKLYQKILTQQPRSEQVLTALGTIALQEGEIAEGVRLLEQSIAIMPEQVLALSNLSIAYTQLERLDEAIESCNKAIALNPQYFEAYTNRGNAEKAAKRWEEAIKSYQQALALFPQDADTCFNLASVYKELKDFRSAAAHFQFVVTINPHDAEALSQCGAMLLELGLHEEALTYFNHALAIDRNIFNYRGRFLSNLALGQYADARQDAENTVLLAPNNPQTYLNLGVVLAKLGLMEDAISAYDKAIVLSPEYAEAYSNRGLVEVQMKRFDQAMVSYNQAIALDATYASAQWNKAILCLLLGDYVQGWALYEWRWQSILKKFSRTFNQPLWLGNQSIKGKTLLVSTEQGLGDFIQFCRYVPLLEKYAAKVVLEVPKPMKQLAATLPGDYTAVVEGNDLPDFDYYCPIMSLPLAFGTDLSTVPATIPYLFADSTKAKRWHQKLGSKTVARIGLVCSGSTVHKNDMHRSIPFELFAELMALPCEFHLLQKVVRETDFSLMKQFSRLYMYQEDLTDFSETAALIEGMDLVISVDTSVAHLAAAMGKPCWILLPYDPDFRWLLNCQQSPWYPTATLFRQPEWGNWDSVIKLVGQKLKEIFFLN